jgi:MYXO-CTERM domain-containing protein
MKTLATAFAIALAAGAARADVIFAESFDSGTLGTFSYQDYKTDEPSSFAWETNEDQALGNFTDGTGAAAVSNSDATPGAYDHALVSPAIHLPAGAIAMTFLTNYQNFANIDFADVDITSNNGAHWENVLRFNEDHGMFYARPGVNETIDLSAYAGQTIQVRFHHYDDDVEANDWYWQVDNFAIHADAVPAPGALGLLGAAALCASRRRR